MNLRVNCPAGRRSIKKQWMWSNLKWSCSRYASPGAKGGGLVGNYLSDTFRARNCTNSGVASSSNHKSRVGTIPIFTGPISTVNTGNCNVGTLLASAIIIIVNLVKSIPFPLYLARCVSCATKDLCLTRILIRIKR